MTDFEVHGARDLEQLSRALKESGDRELRKVLLASIRKTNKPTIDHVRESARENLPSTGGLADLVAASKIGTRTRLTTKAVGIEIRGTGKSVRNLRRLNEGKLRRPLFGNKSYWFEQDVRPNWFTDPIEKDLPRIHQGLTHVMGDVAQKIKRSV